MKNDEIKLKEIKLSLLTRKLDLSSEFYRGFLWRSNGPSEKNLMTDLQSQLGNQNVQSLRNLAHGSKQFDGKINLIE